MAQRKITGQNPISTANVSNIPRAERVILHQVLQYSPEKHTVIKRRCQKTHFQALVQVIDKLLLAVEIARISFSIHQPFFRLVKQLCQLFNVVFPLLLSERLKQRRIQLGDPADADPGQILFYLQIQSTSNKNYRHLYYMGYIQD
jgi:hypothetical protein